jgi:RNA polymerase sigma-70 factor (ECF subfamily)
MSEQVVAHASRLYAETCAESPVLEDSALDGSFARLYSSAFPKVYSFIRSQVGNVQTAQEIVGRVFLKAYKHRRKAPSGEASIQWVFRIAHTTLIDYWRVEGRWESASVSIEELADLPGEFATPDAAYAAKERKALLLAVVSDLDKDDHSILALKFMGQRTNREIAEILGVTEGAVSMRLLRALRRVRHRLLELGITS